MAAARQQYDNVATLLNTIMPYFECCFCRCTQHEPVILSCLHNFCRSCIESKTMRTSNVTVVCCICFEGTKANEVTTNNFLFTYGRLSVLFSDSVLCNTCDASKEQAEFWCADCCEGLCFGCYPKHNMFTNHHLSAELEVARKWSLSHLVRSGRLCSEHKRPMEALCFTCCFTKCVVCSAICKRMGHECRLMPHVQTQQHLSRVINDIVCTIRRLNRLLSEVVPRCHEMISRLWAARAAGGKLLVKHQNIFHKSKVKAFFESDGELHAHVERLWCNCLDGRTKAVWLICAKNSEGLAHGAFRSMQLLGAAGLVKAVILRNTSSCRNLVRELQHSWKESKSMSIDGAAPLTADIVLSGCLGFTVCKRDAPPAPLQFGQASVTFRLPVYCPDLAATRDGHVLLAAGENGLLVYSDRGLQLSNWRPARRTNGRPDEVTCVAELSDKRAAVGVVYAQLIVVLKCSQMEDRWLEYRHVTTLPSPPARLAAHGDLLAAAEGIFNEQHGWEPRRHVKLLRLSSGELLYTQSRDYDIRRVSLTALCIVTTSRDPVKRKSGATPYALEAFSHSGNLLWCYETNEEELVDSLCVSVDTWSRVYVSVVRRDWKSSRVVAIDGADGKNMTDVISSKTHGLQIPVWLSLARGQLRTVLAVVSWDTEPGANGLYFNVSMYEAKIE